MRRLLWSGFGLAVLAAIVSAAASAHSYGNGELVVFARVRSISELVVVAPGGAPSHRIAQGGANTSISADAWSPDGRKLVFAFSSKDGEGLLIVPAGGGAVRRLSWLSTPYNDAEPAWSPDGRWIAFVRTVARRRVSVFVVHPDGSALHRVMGYGRTMTTLSWAPGSRRLLVVVQPQGQICSRVEIVRLGGPTRTVPGAFCSTSPSWSPNGRRVAFIKGTTARTRLVVENRDGSGRRILVRTYADHPTWSPDGKRIAFSLYKPGDLGGALSLATIGADGAGLHVLTENQAWSDIPRSWSPSGRWILFERSDAFEDFDGADLRLIHRDGSSEHAIARNTKPGTGTWKPR